MSGGALAVASDGLERLVALRARRLGLVEHALAGPDRVAAAAGGLGQVAVAPLRRGDGDPGAGRVVVALLGAGALDAEVAHVGVGGGRRLGEAPGDRGDDRLVLVEPFGRPLGAGPAVPALLG